MRFYIDSTYCEWCKERHILKVPYSYACDHLDEFMELNDKQDVNERQHMICVLLEGIRQFLSQPVVIMIDK